MALTDDQRAMLRLLARREEGYEDIAALMGISVEEVRARVRDSLAALDAETSADAPTAAAPSPPVVEPEPPPPAPASPAPTPSPAAPSTPPAETAAAAKPSLAARAGAWAGRLRDGNRRRLVELVGGGLIVLLIVLFATGTIDFGGDDDGGSGNDNPAAAANGQQQPTQAELSAVDGSDAKGQAVFGRLKQQVALVIAAEGMRSTPKGSSYAISLAKGPDERVPIAAVRVPKGGQIAEQIEVPPEALGLLANGFDTMELSLVVNKDLRRILTQSQGAKEPPIFEATDVLRGEVTGPIVDAATD